MRPPCAPHAFALAEPLRGAGDRVRCERCGLTLSAREAACWSAGYARGSEASEVASWRAPARRGRGPRAALAILAAAVLAAAVGARPRGALPPASPPDGVAVAGSCVELLASLEGDAEALWARRTGAAIVGASRAPVRAALADFERAVADLDETLYDQRHCADNQVPGCARHMGPRLTDQRRRAAESVALLQKRIDDARLSASALPEPSRRLDPVRRP